MAIDHTRDEKQAIKAFATASNGSSSIREAAIAAHRALLERARRERQPLPYGNPYFEFMLEVDCPVPDLLLRFQRRQEVFAAST